MYLTETKCEAVKWVNWVQDGDQWQTFVNTNLHCTLNIAYLFTR